MAACVQIGLSGPRTLGPGQQGTLGIQLFILNPEFVFPGLPVFFLQYLFVLLDPADTTLGEVDLDMAGELPVNHVMHYLLQLFEFLKMFFFLLTHVILFVLAVDDMHLNR